MSPMSAGFGGGQNALPTTTRHWPTMSGLSTGGMCIEGRGARPRLCTHGRTGLLVPYRSLLQMTAGGQLLLQLCLCARTAPILILLL